jgi:hypothetical protein
MGEAVLDVSKLPSLTLANEQSPNGDTNDRRVVYLEIHTQLEPQPVHPRQCMLAQCDDLRLPQTGASRLVPSGPMRSTERHASLRGHSHRLAHCISDE